MSNKPPTGCVPEYASVGGEAGDGDTDVIVDEHDLLLMGGQL